jgi:NADH-quinone oxidoreductase subunit C
MEFEKIVELIQSVNEGTAKVDSNTSPLGVIISSDRLVVTCNELYQNPSTYFDMLSCVTGIDNGVEANTMEVIYHLYSIPFNASLMLKVILPRENPEVESLCGVWKSANWLEREVYDMFGINFKNHPDLRRILMPNDWEGYPLRKDYQHQELYRDIVVKSEY